MSEGTAMTIVFVGSIVALFALSGLFVLIAWPFMSWSCSARWEGTCETQYGPVQGCRVKVNGVFFPEDRVREVQ